MKNRQSVFKDESKLDLNYVPDRLPHREKEHRLLIEFFKFLTRFPDKMAQRVIVTGDVGTGKTALCQRFGEDIMSEVKKTGVELRYVHVNCREYRGKLVLIVQHVLGALKPTFPKRGYSSEEVLTSLLQVLDEQNLFVILALDEFDNLVDAEGSDGVYSLTRLQEMRAHKPQRLSLICITRNLASLGKLDESARSTLQRNIISLNTYGKAELVDILNSRVELAFEPFAVAEDAVALAADLAQEETGNARFAIELLWRAGKFADADEGSLVSPDCVRKAVSAIIPVAKSELDSLGLHEKLFLLGAAEVFKEDEKAYASMAEVEEAYAVACEEFDVQPHGRTQVWKYIHVLSKTGILKSQLSSSVTRGRSRQISLPAVSAVELEKELRFLLEKEKR